MDEAGIRALMVYVIRKEYLAQLSDRGKISPARYIEAVNTIRVAEGLPPLSREETGAKSRAPVRDSLRGKGQG